MKIDHLQKKIENKSVLKDISFELGVGEIIGLIGRNGEGKTTLFRTIANHYIKDGGDIYIDNQNIEEHLVKKEKIFYLDTQYTFFNNMKPIKIGEYYHLFYSEFDFERYQALIETYRLPAQTPFKRYSKGMQGLLRIILAICSNCPYILLDEPFDGLDIIVKKQVIRLVLDEISDQTRSVIISSHNLQELDYLIDRALILKNGEIIQDYKLDDARETIKKIQMLFSDHSLPELIKNNSTIIQIRGKVVVGIFENLTEELLAQINELNPLLFEELPISLEDLFTVNLTHEFDYDLKG